jgi:hypothetical protein
MLDKLREIFKSVFNWLINAFVILGTAFGYMWFCIDVGKEIFGEYASISLILGAFIYGYYWKKNEDNKNFEHKNQIMQNVEKEHKTLNFTRFIYETNYSSLKVIDKMVLSSDHFSEINIYLKTGEKIKQEIDNISWIQTEEQLSKLDKYLDSIIEKIDTSQKTLFNLGLIQENNIDEYFKDDKPIENDRF